MVNQEKADLVGWLSMPEPGCEHPETTHDWAATLANASVGEHLPAELEHCARGDSRFLLWWS